MVHLRTDDVIITRTPLTLRDSDRDRPVMTCSFANKCIHTQTFGTGEYLFILTFDILRDDGKRKIFTNFLCFTEYF